VRVPEEKLEKEIPSNLMQGFHQRSFGYFGADRLEKLEEIKCLFDAVLDYKLQEIESTKHKDAAYLIVTEQQATEIVNTCGVPIQRIETGTTRLMSSRLRTRVVEDFLIQENNIVNALKSLIVSRDLLMDETLSDNKAEFSYQIWHILRTLLDDTYKFVLILDSSLEGTAYRERQRRGEHGHWTTTATERKMD